jgi:hypothetical protein
MCCRFVKIHLPRNFPEFFYRVIRGALYAFTFILCILGISFVTFSFWYIYEGKNYHLDNSIKFGVFSVSFLIGSTLFCLATCGLVGVLREKLILAKIFLFGVIFLMVFELTCIFFIYAYKREILIHANSLFQKFISQYADDDDIRLLVDTIQSELKCCGISSPNDWDRNPYYKCGSISTLACSVPASCCYNFSFDKSNKLNMFCGVGIRKNESINKLYHLIHVTGCKYSIYSFLDYKHKLTASVLIGVLVPQMIGVILIISFIILLSYLIDFDSIEGSKYIIQLDRSNFDLVEPKNPFEDKKNLFILSIGSNNDFLRRTSLKNYGYDSDKISEHDEENQEENKQVSTEETNKETAIAIINCNESNIDDNREKVFSKLVNFKQFIESSPPKFA